MFKRLLNECTIELRIEPEGALLIKSGIPQLGGVDMAWVRVYRNGQPEVYLPGSSLKGTIRSHAERIARTINDNASCDVFGGSKGRPRSCGDALNIMKRGKRERDLSTKDVYSHSCLICRLFGNTWLLGRFATEDAYVEGEPPETQTRDGVGIDRFTGGAARGAKFELEVITGGVFKTKLHIQNFELWQLGLLGFVLHDMQDGLVRMGSGKSRGLGKVVATVEKITLHQLGKQHMIVENGHIHLFGAGKLFSEASDYGMLQDDPICIERKDVELPESPLSKLRQTAVITFEDFPWQQLAERWISFAESYQDKLESYRRGKP